MPFCYSKTGGPAHQSRQRHNAPGTHHAFTVSDICRGFALRAGSSSTTCRMALRWPSKTKVSWKPCLTIIFMKLLHIRFSSGLKPCCRLTFGLCWTNASHSPFWRGRASSCHRVSRKELSQNRQCDPRFSLLDTRLHFCIDCSRLSAGHEQ
jgi:hypothetical protein